MIRLGIFIQHESQELHLAGSKVVLPQWQVSYRACLPSEGGINISELSQPFIKESAGCFKVLLYRDSWIFFISHDSW